MLAPAGGVSLALLVFVPFAAGYFLSYLFRTVNAVIAPDLTAALDLEAGALGLLTSAYFLTFAAFQLPLGVLLDRFGPRRVEAGLLLLAGAGALVFAAGDAVGTLVIGRALIGLGVSACLMAAFKAFVLWFPSERIPFVNGCVMAAGGLGALTATAPVEALLQWTDWRGLFRLLGVFAFAVAAAIFLLVPEREDDGRAPERLDEQFAGVRSVFASVRFWRIAPITTMAQAGFLAIQTLWTGPWLRDVAGLDRAAVAGHLLVIAGSMVAGFLLVGAIAGRLARAGIAPIVVAGTGMGLFIVCQLGIILVPDASPLLLWIAFGFFGTANILVYAILPQAFPKQLAGRVITGLNVLVFVAAFVGQWGIGAIIDRWDPMPSGGYDPVAYQAAFGCVLALQVLAFAWFVLLRRRPDARL